MAFCLGLGCIFGSFRIFLEFQKTTRRMYRIPITSPLCRVSVPVFRYRVLFQGNTNIYAFTFLFRRSISTQLSHNYKAVLPAEITFKSLKMELIYRGRNTYIFFFSLALFLSFGALVHFGDAEKFVPYTPG